MSRAITASDFQKAFLRSANRPNGLGRPALANGNWLDEPVVPWRELALKAFENNQLGDALERAIASLPINCSQVLFLHDVKNLNVEEAAWILNINVGEVRALLLRARMQVYDALIPPLSVRAGEEEDMVSVAWVQDGGQPLDALTSYL